MRSPSLNKLDSLFDDPESVTEEDLLGPQPKDSPVEEPILVPKRKRGPRQLRIRTEVLNPKDFVNQPIPEDKILEKTGRGIVPRSGFLDPDYDKFIKALGPQSELRMALAHHGSEKAMNFLMDIVSCSKGKSAANMAVLAKKNGIPMDQMGEIWRSYSLSKGLMTYIGKAPVLAEQTLEDAAPIQVACPACGGRGELLNHHDQEEGDEYWQKWLSCPQCKGFKTVRRVGSDKARDTIHEALGWTKKGGPQVQVNIGGGHNLESVIGGIDEALSSPVIDV